MNGNPAVADHLAEIDARFEAHVSSLRQRAEKAREAIATGSAALEAALPKPKFDLSRVPVEEPPPYRPAPSPPPPSPMFDDAIIPDAPIGAVSPVHTSSPPPPLEEISLDDDGIPLWQD